MKNIKKIVSMLLAMLILMGVCVFSSSAAATDAPTFELSLVSQEGKKAVFELCLVDGAFKTFDVTLKTSSAITAVNYIITTDSFNKFVKELKMNGGAFSEASYTATKKISLSSTLPINKPTSIYEIAVTKASNADLTENDLTAFFSECIGIKDTSVCNKVKVSTVFGTISIDESVTMNYKNSVKLNLDTSFSDTSKIKWSSSNTAVATVDENGNVYAAGRGSAVITAESADGKISDTCNVTVNYSTIQWIIIIVLFGWLWY